MRKYQWMIAAAALTAAHSVAALGEVPTTPGSDAEQLAGGNWSAAGVRPGSDVMLPQRLIKLKKFDALGLHPAKDPMGDPVGIAYRKQRQLAMVDIYPLAGFHISAGYRSWKGRMPKGEFGSALGVGRFNINQAAPLLPIKGGRSNRAPIATAGYQTRVAENTLIGFETGVVSEKGSNWMETMSRSDPHRGWAKTGALAQASVKMRFF